MKRGAVLAVAAAAVLSGAVAVVAQQSKGGNRWIVDAGSDAERFERIEKYLRGFDQPMWEVGERYEKMRQAVARENWDLAAYHWDKIKTTVENGTMKRPARKANADALFLDKTWDAVKEALTSRDPARVQVAMAVARGACMSCHQAEKVEWVNNQAMFDGG